MEQQHSLQICYEIVKPRFLGLTYLDFAETVKDYEIIPIELHGEVVGAILRKDHELHALVKENARKRWFNKNTIKFIKDTLDKYGFITTKVKNDYQMGHDFAVRLGFTVDKIENDITHYIKVKL